MKKCCFYVLSIIFILFILTSTFSCAKIGYPTGGPRDTIPPYLVWSNPKPYATNFKGHRIVMRFNEFFVLKNLNKNFFASPPFRKMPKIYISGKKLIVKLRDTLRDSATYTLEFGNAIADYTEGNVLKNFKFVFSTYNHIDSLRVAGKVVDAYTMEPVSGVYVMLYNYPCQDSVVFKYPPKYATVTDDSGRFMILGVKQGRYKIFALKDLNHDFIYDGIENQVAFSKQIIEPKVEVRIVHDTLPKGTIIHDATTGKIIDTLKHDSVVVRRIVHYLPDSLVLRMFEENNRPQQIVYSARIYPFLIDIRFNFPLLSNYYKIVSSSLDSNQYFADYYRNTDSLKIWITDTSAYSIDTMNFIFKFYNPKKNGRELVYDTAWAYQPLKYRYDYKLTVENNQINYFDSLVFNTNILIRRINRNHVYLVQQVDTQMVQTYDNKVRCLRIEPNQIWVLFKYKPDSTINTFIPGYQNAHLNRFYDTADNILKITLPKFLASNDTVPFYLSYWQKRYYKFPEFKYCKTKLLLIRQGLKTSFWPTPQHIVLFFAKPVRDFSVEGLSYDSIKIHRERVDLWFKPSQDSVDFRIKTLDFRNLEVKPVYYQTQIKMKYVYKPNKVIAYERPSRDYIKFLFSRRLDSVKNIGLWKYSVKQSHWYSYEIRGDTLVLRFLNKDLKRMKFLDIVINYWDHDFMGPVLLHDTIHTELYKNQMVKNTILYRPQAYCIRRDTVDSLKYILTSKFRQGADYKLIFQPKSIEFVDYTRNDSVIHLSFQTTKAQDFGTLELTLPYKIGRSYWMIVQLLNKDGDVVYEKIFTHGKNLEMTHLVAGKYHLRIIEDLNKNGRWDTGNYLRGQLPEPVIIFTQPIVIKAGWKISQQIDKKDIDNK